MHFSSFGLLNWQCNRPRSPQRKIMARKRGKLNGHLLREHYMDFKHRKLQISSMTRVAIESCLRLRNRPRDERRLQGTYTFNYTSFLTTYFRLRNLHLYGF